MKAIQTGSEYADIIEKQRNPDRELYSMVRFLLGLTVAFLVFVNVFTHVLIGVRVSGPSMNPTLNGGTLAADGRYYGGNYLFVFAWGRPDYGDIVVFYNGHEECIKRVIGLPGDTVYAIDGVLWRARSGEEAEVVEEPYIIDGWTGNIKPVVVPEGCMYVLGDNRLNSTDSRSFGPVKISSTLGVVTDWSFAIRDFLTPIMNAITFQF